MAGRHTLPNGFEKVRPGRAALATCWAVDLVLALSLGSATVIITGLAMSPFNAHHYNRFGLSPIGVMRPWVVAFTISAGAAVAVASMTLGKGGRSMGHAFAELRIDGPGGLRAAVGRRLSRGVLVVAVFGALASWSVVVALLVVLALWLPSLVTQDRRGPFEWVTGLTDYAVAPVENQRVGAMPTIPDEAARQD
jgi:hypothetical protein